MGMVRFLPFAGSGDLGIDMRLGEDLGMPPTDAGVERATEEVVADLLSLSSDGESEDEARAPPGAPGPTAAELFDEGERALEEEKSSRGKRDGRGAGRAECCRGYHCL